MKSSWLVAVIAIVSFILTALEPCEIHSKRLYMIKSIIFLHHFLKLYVFVVPLVHGDRLPKSVLWAVIIGLVYMTVQNNIIFDVTVNPQTCIVSQYTNKECKQPPNAMLRDCIYYFNGKSNMNAYITMFTTYTIVYIIYLLSIVLRK